MSDHDASPKEWTPAHSEKHGPQRWLSKQQRKQIKAQQAYIAAITAGNIAVVQPHFSYPTFATSSAAAAASSSSSASRRRRSSGDSAAAVDAASASSSQHSTPGPEDSDAASAVSVPPDIEEEEEITSESDEDDSQRLPAAVGDGALPFAVNSGHLRRLSSAPLPQSFSDMDGSWIPEARMQLPPAHAPLLQPTQPWCGCAACQTAAAHQVAAQQQYLQSLARAHSQRASPASSHQTPAQSVPFTVALSPPLHSRQSMARRSMQLIPVAGSTDGSTFAEASPAGVTPGTSSILSAARASSAFTTPVPILPRQFTTVEAQRASANLVAAANMPLSTAAVAAAAAIAAAASPASAVASSPSPTPTPAPLASVSMLPRWFLILLAVLKETDGRDKIAKCVQYGGRSLAILLRKLPAAMWWIAFASKHLSQGRVGTIGRAIHVFLAGDNPLTSAVTAAGETVSNVAVTAQSTFATALRASYAADTSALRAKLQSSYLYTETLSRIAVLTAALSSGRRMIRVVKWTYTLPNWCKAYQAWRTQVRASMEAQATANRAAEEEEARAQEAKQQQQESASADDGDSKKHARSLSAATTALSVPSASAANRSSPRFRFSHPHPPHLISRLPWLSSVELMDLSIAVLTDMTDDLEWLSKYRLFPSRWGYFSGRLAMAFWFTTVLLDLALTFRILKHYNYQQREIQGQIDEAQMEYATCAHEMETRMEARAMREMRREQLRSIQKSPLFKRRSGGAATENLEPLGPPALLPVSAVLVTPQPQPQPQQLAASAGSDASWSVLSDAAQSSSSSRGGVQQQGSSSVSSHESASMGGDSIGSGSGSNSSSKSSSRSVSSNEHADEVPPTTIAFASPPPNSKQPHQDSALEADAEVAQASGGPAASRAAQDDEEFEDADASTIDLLQSASVVAYRRVSSLRSQLSAIQQSLFLQYLNFAKFTFDLGCATPMAWGVQAEHDTLVQTTGLVSGMLGLYKLMITTKPAS